jgi:hypothetical protein
MVEDQMAKTSEFMLFDREINVLTPDSFIPDIADVFRALPKINRFNGHTTVTYSVARHSIACVNASIEIYKVKDATLLLSVLLHDAAEAFIGDIVRPIKQQFNPTLYQLEDEILTKILESIGFIEEDMCQCEAFSPTMFELDTRMAATEADVLTKNKVLPDVERLDTKFVSPYDWTTDEYVFRALYYNLMKIRNTEYKLEEL